MYPSYTQHEEEEDYVCWPETTTSNAIFCFKNKAFLVGLYSDLLPKPTPISNYGVWGQIANKRLHVWFTRLDERNERLII